MKKSKIPQDVFGNIAVLKFPKRTFSFIKKIKAKRFLRENKNIKTVLEKTSKFSGRLRKFQTKHIAGAPTKEATYKENGLTFKFNVEDAYFSPRLSHERNIVSEEVISLIKNKKNPKILVMCAGISPYPMVLARKMKERKIKGSIISNELNKKANSMAKENIVQNNLENYITLVEGDAKKLDTKLKEKFDVILMPRPNLKETFLKTALKLSKKGTKIFYHGFGVKEEVEDEINAETKGKIKDLHLRKAGDIGPYIYRWQADFIVK